MAKAEMTRERLSIDVLPEEKELSILTMNLNQDPILKELWDDGILTKWQKKE